VALYFMPSEGLWHWWISLPWNIWIDYTDKSVRIVAVIIAGG